MTQCLRFLAVAGLKLAGLVIAQSGVFMVRIARLLAVLVGLNIGGAAAPTEQGVDGTLSLL